MYTALWAIVGSYLIGFVCGGMFTFHLIAKKQKQFIGKLKEKDGDKCQ